MEAQTAEREERPAVLLVEDDLALGQLVSGMLDEAGYRAVVIADHSEIGAAIDRFAPACVILDGELGRTGQSRSWGDAATIRRVHPALPVVMFTADADALAEERVGTSRRSREAGFVGVVPKPFSADEFLATIRSAVATPPPIRSDELVLPDPIGPSASEWAQMDFFNAAVHELKAPLATISGQVQLARKLITKDPARGRVAIGIAMQQVERMTDLIASLQDQLRLRSIGSRLNVVTFDLCEGISNAISRHEHGEAKRFRLDRPEERIRVQGDPDRIAQILDNLLNNALKYSPPNSPVDITVTTVAGEAQVRVEDYGIGVAAEERDRMFTAYYRSSRTRAIPGSGLGLHISRQLAEQHGGRLWLDDSTDAGSVFALALPLAD